MAAAGGRGRRPRRGRLAATGRLAALAADAQEIGGRAGDSARAEAEESRVPRRHRPPPEGRRPLAGPAGRRPVLQRPAGQGAGHGRRRGRDLGRLPGLRSACGRLSDDYRNWAGIYAGTSGSHPDSYWQAVGRYLDSDAWYDAQLRQARAFGEPSAAAAGSDLQWQWRNQDLSASSTRTCAPRPTRLRSARQDAALRALNRAVSVYDAVRNGGRPDADGTAGAGTSLLGLDLALEVAPGGATGRPRHRRLELLRCGGAGASIPGGAAWSASALGGLRRRERAAQGWSSGSTTDARGARGRRCRGRAGLPLRERPLGPTSPSRAWPAWPGARRARSSSATRRAARSTAWTRGPASGSSSTRRACARTGRRRPHRRVQGAGARRRQPVPVPLRSGRRLPGPSRRLPQIDPAYETAPFAFDIDVDGRLVVTDVGEQQVLLLDSFLALTGRIGGPGPHREQFDQPRGICFLPDGGFMVSDQGNRRLQRFSRLGYWDATVGGSSTSTIPSSRRRAWTAIAGATSSWPIPRPGCPGAGSAGPAGPLIGPGLSTSRARPSDRSMWRSVRNSSLRSPTACAAPCWSSTSSTSEPWPGRWAVSRPSRSSGHRAGAGLLVAALARLGAARGPSPRARRPPAGRVRLAGGRTARWASASSSWCRPAGVRWPWPTERSILPPVRAARRRRDVWLPERDFRLQSRSGQVVPLRDWIRRRHGRGVVAEYRFQPGLSQTRIGLRPMTPPPRRERTGRGPGGRAAALVPDRGRRTGGARQQVGQVSSGSRRDLTVQQNLRLNISGQLTRDIHVRASLTDDNLPVVPEGNTEKLQDIDQVLVELTAPRWQATLGDFVAHRGGTRTGRLPPQAAGLRRHGAARRGQRAGALFGSPRGRYRTVELRGQEANQGPYFLGSGAVGQNLFIVAGSERVVMDGQVLTRGSDRDYVIDYVRGTVTFTYRRLVTAETLIRGGVRGGRGSLRTDGGRRRRRRRDRARPAAGGSRRPPDPRGGRCRPPAQRRAERRGRGHPARRRRRSPGRGGAAARCRSRRPGRLRAPRGRARQVRFEFVESGGDWQVVFFFAGSGQGDYELTRLTEGGARVYTWVGIRPGQLPRRAAAAAAVRRRPW
jgi:hypothetical protein